MSYKDLLAVFWRSHNPAARPWSRQYASAVFYADAEQRRAAEASRDRFEACIGRPILTVIEPLGRFYRAEDRHQKYRLRANPLLFSELSALYANETAFVDSTAAARVNGFLDGGNLRELRRDLARLGLSTHGQELLLEVVRAHGTD